MIDLFSLVYDSLEEDDLLRGTIHVSMLEYKEKLTEVNRVSDELKINAIMNLGTGPLTH